MFTCSTSAERDAFQKVIYLQGVTKRYVKTVGNRSSHVVDENKGFPQISFPVSNTCNLCLMQLRYLKEMEGLLLFLGRITVPRVMKGLEGWLLLLVHNGGSSVCEIIGRVRTGYSSKFKLQVVRYAREN